MNAVRTAISSVRSENIQHIKKCSHAFAHTFWYKNKQITFSKPQKTICANVGQKGKDMTELEYMGMREKLIDLAHDYFDSVPWYADIADLNTEELIDHLIANGVTIQKWISVKDRLPEQGQEVIVYSGGVLKPTVFAYQFWNKNYDSWARITHWMPLPEPPSGERNTDGTCK